MKVVDQARNVESLFAPIIYDALLGHSSGVPAAIESVLDPCLRDLGISAADCREGIEKYQKVFLGCCAYSVDSIQATRFGRHANITAQVSLKPLRRIVEESCRRYRLLRERDDQSGEKALTAGVDVGAQVQLEHPGRAAKLFFAVLEQATREATAQTVQVDLGLTLRREGGQRRWEVTRDHDIRVQYPWILTELEPPPDIDA